MKPEYKVKIGLVKSIKNTLIVWGVPAVILLLDNWTEWIPRDYHKVSIPILGVVAYFVKNYIQNK